MTKLQLPNLRLTFVNTFPSINNFNKFEGTKGLRRKVWTLTKILSLNICHTFWESLGKRMPFGSKTVLLGQEVHYYMVYIAYYTELDLQICDYALKLRICRGNSKYYALDENFPGRFCLRRKAANFCHPDSDFGPPIPRGSLQSLQTGVFTRRK